MTFADVVLKLWEKGGVPLLFIIGGYLLFKFMGARIVKAFDNIATVQNESITKIADAVTASSTAQVVALGGLTDRVSRMESKVDTLGMLAVREAQAMPPQPRAVTVVGAAVATAIEVFDDDGETPIGVPIPTEPQAHPIIPSIPKRNTPAKGSPTAYHHARAPTSGGQKR